VLADQCERRLDLSQGAHVLQQLVGPQQITTHRDQRRIAALGRAVDVEADVNDLVGGHA
jgi:hypothetical protein